MGGRLFYEAQRWGASRREERGERVVDYDGENVDFLFAAFAAHRQSICKRMKGWEGEGEREECMR